MAVTAAPAPTVVCFFNQLHVKTIEALQKWSPDVIWQNTSEDIWAYGKALGDFWDSAEGDLIVIEQDIEIRPWTITHLTDCDHPWCTYGYWLFGELRGGAWWAEHGLGCVKFSASLRHHVPWSLVEHLGADPGSARADGSSPVRWDRLDTSIADLMMYKGIKRPHCHGEITHLHDYNDDMYSPDTRKPLPSVEQRQALFRGEQIEGYRVNPENERDIGGVFPR